MGEQMKVFISHDVENDGHIATTLKDKLTLLSAKKIKALVCSQDILGGGRWRAWMTESVTAADLFIYLYSNDQHQQYWLNYEVGLYLGSHGSEPGPICIMNDYLKSPPQILAEYQHYKGNSEGIRKFFEDLLIHNRFSDGDKINEAIMQEPFVTEMADAVKDLAGLFHRNKIEVDVFENRIAVQLEDDSDSVGNLDDAVVVVDEGTSSYLQLRRNTDSWGSLKSQFSDRRASWIPEFEKLVRNIADGIPPDKHMSLTPFNLHDNEICYPVISRIKRRGDMPVSLLILFVSSEPENKNFRQINAPHDLSNLMMLLNMARRFRWNVIEPGLQGLRKKKRLELDHAQLLEELWVAVRRLEAEADDAGFLSEATVRRAFTGGRRQLIVDMFGQWYSLKESLKRNVEQGLLTETIEVLEKLQAVNKKSLIAIVEEYRDRLETVEPQPANDADKQSRASVHSAAV
ncbi:MAG: TIR domain-containing protein [Woeseiaceae bacterium]|nr:TIR domain-containing protein [Woeseiaceae bacterium]